MQDAIGIGLLFGLALLFRLCFHSTIGLSITRHDVARVIPFNLITFWVLLVLAGVWALARGFAFVARPR